MSTFVKGGYSIVKSDLDKGVLPSKPAPSLSFLGRKCVVEKIPKGAWVESVYPFLNSQETIKCRRLCKFFNIVEEEFLTRRFGLPYGPRSVQVHALRQDFKAAHDKLHLEFFQPISYTLTYNNGKLVPFDNQAFITNDAGAMTVFGPHIGIKTLRCRSMVFNFTVGEKVVVMLLQDGSLEVAKKAQILRPKMSLSKTSSSEISTFDLFSKTSPSESLFETAPSELLSETGSSKLLSLTSSFELAPLINSSKLLSAEVLKSYLAAERPGKKTSSSGKEVDELISGLKALQLVSGSIKRFDSIAPKREQYVTCLAIHEQLNVALIGCSLGALIVVSLTDPSNHYLVHPIDPHCRLPIEKILSVDTNTLYLFANSVRFTLRLDQLTKVRDGEFTANSLVPPMFLDKKAAALADKTRKYDHAFWTAYSKSSSIESGSVLSVNRLPTGGYAVARERIGSDSARAIFSIQSFPTLHASEASSISPSLQISQAKNLSIEKDMVLRCWPQTDPYKQSLEVSQLKSDGAVKKLCMMDKDSLLKKHFIYPDVRFHQLALQGSQVAFVAFGAFWSDSSAKLCRGLTYFGVIECGSAVSKAAQEVKMEKMEEKKELKK